MHLSAAPWLLLLFPWLALAIWMWRQEARVVAISNPMHWPRSFDVARKRSARRSTPPMWVLFALAALLTAILALSQPSLPSNHGRITVLIDPHVSMTATVAGRQVYEEAAARITAVIEDVDGPIETELVVPGSVRPPASLGDVASIDWTAKPTAPLMEQRAAEEVAKGKSVVVISAQVLRLPAEVLRIGPTTLPSDRGIAGVAASIEPRPQVMVTVQHARGSREIRFEVVTSGGQGVQGKLAPAADATESMAFVDVPDGTADWIEARLLDTDDFEANDRAFLVREGDWPRLELQGELPAGVERFAAVYSVQRPPGPRSRTILLTTKPPTEGPAAEFAPTRRLNEEQTASVQLPWKPISGLDPVGVGDISDDLPSGLETIAKLGDRPILAVRRELPRQVWVGIGVESMAGTAPFVSWMNGIIDFLNQGETPRWASYPPDAVTPAWRFVEGVQTAAASPGIYRLPGGEVRAVSFQPFQWAGEGSSEKDLRFLLAAARQQGRVSLDGYLCWVSLALGLAAAALTARARRLDGKGGAT